MPEYIEREALIKDINETVVFTVRKGVQLPTAEMRGANKVIDRIKSSPTADVIEVRHGEWLEFEDNFLDTLYQCSACKEDFVLIEGTPSENRWNYCPNCGAKMDGKGD